MYHCLEKVKHIVQENMIRPQTKQKEWYHKKAWDLQLEEGDQVLVLLPTQTEKLLAKWKRPYHATENRKVNCEIETPGGQKDKKIFHVSMLKWWKPPEKNFVNVISDEQEDIPYPTEEQQRPKDAEYEENLIEEQQTQMEDVLHQYSSITGARHGSTTKVKNQIITNNQQPIREGPYHIPPALKKDVITELDELLKTWVVKTFTSNWAPSLWLRKKMAVTESAWITVS